MRRWLIGILVGLGTFAAAAGSASAAGTLPVIYRGFYGYSPASPSASLWTSSALGAPRAVAELPP